MEFTFEAKFAPKWNTTEIYHDFIGKDWFRFQLAVYVLGQSTLAVIHDLINKTAQYKGKAKTNKLIDSIKLTEFSGMGEVSWGIGQISEMNQLAPYWYLVNFGGATFKGEYHITPGEFDTGGIFQYDPSAKTGKRLPSGTKGINYPLHYIENAQLYVDDEIRTIIEKIKARSI